MNMLILIILSYLIGSIPFALVIGKVFYKTDVREHGSKNLGGGNTGRVLGKKAGLSVMTMDILKVSFVVFLATRLCGNDQAIALSGLMAAIGHCYPVFARFKGGKAVATMYGFMFGLIIFVGYSPLLFLLPLLVFLLVLYLTKIISLSSMVSAAAAAFYACLTTESISIQAVLILFAVFIVVRHRKNIERMMQRRENKISWM